jgi:hypothetical protein
MRKLKNHLLSGVGAVVDATEPFSFELTEDVVREAIRRGLSGRGMMALAIMKSSNPNVSFEDIVVDDDGHGASAKMRGQS